MPSDITLKGKYNVGIINLHDLKLHLRGNIMLALLICMI